MNFPPQDPTNNTINRLMNNDTDNSNTNRYQIQDNALVVSLAINTLISLGTLLLFCILRKRFRLFYQYRVEKKQNGVIKPQRDGFFSWIADTIKYDNRTIIDTSGIDSYMYLRNLKTNLKIVATILVVGWIVLFPTNSAGKYNENRKVDNDGVLPDKVIGLSTLSMGNIERGSDLLWVHFWFVSFVTMVVLFFTYRDYKEYTNLRIQFKKSNRLCNYTIFLRDIPISLFTKQDLINYFQQYIAGDSQQVIDVSLQYPISGIHSLIDEREYYVKRYDSSIAKYNKSKKRPLLKSGLFGWCGNKVDSIDYYNNKINDIEIKIQEKKRKCEENYHNLISREKNIGKDQSKSAGNGFIIFKEKSIQKELVQSIMQKRDNILMSRYYAMDPNDVYYPNIQIGGKSLYIRNLVVMAITFLLIFFYGIPVTFVAGFSNLGTLSKIKAFSWLVDLISYSPKLTAFLSGFLPSLALIIFMAFLIPILTVFSKMSGYYSNSRIEASVFSKYFLFLVFNVFLVYAIAGTIFQSISAIIDNPPSITTTLANSLGGLSYGMINYVLLASTALTWDLLRLTDLMISLFKLKFLCKTKREINEAQETELFKYGQLYAYNLLVLQLCFAYCTLSPFILIFGVWYFGVSYLVHKYNIIWANRPHITSLLYPMSFRRTMIALLIYHLLMIGTFNIYSFYYGTFLVVPLFITAAFWAYCEYTFYPVSKHGLLDTLNRFSGKDGDNYASGSSGSINNQDEISEKVSLLSAVSQPSNSHFNDNTYSINEYNENLYKPRYYRTLMEPEETINDYVEIQNSNPPNFLNV